MTHRQSVQDLLRTAFVSAMLIFVLQCLSSKLAAQTCAPPNCWTGNFYQYEIVASSGESVQIGTVNGTFTGFGVSPSINENGTVAFVGQVDVSGVPFGDTLFLGNADSTSLTAVAPDFLDLSRTFDDAVQINDSNQVVAQDRADGAPPSTYLRVWDGNNPGIYTLVTEATGSSQDKYSAVLTDPAINSTNSVAFSALNKLSDGVLVSADPPYSTLNQVFLNTPLRPLIADDGSVVVRDGDTDSSPIVLYSKDLVTPLTIASSAEFSALGQSPGISRDGAVVAFAGNLTTSGVWDAWPGPGIFIATIENAAITHRMRIAGFHVADLGQVSGTKDIEGICLGGTGSGCTGGTYFRAEGSPWCDASAAQCLDSGELEDLPPFSKPTFVFFNTFTAAGFLASTEWENRIAVTHAQFGSSGIDGDTVVVSFVATPNMNDFTGLDLFSANQGIWSVSADLFVPTTGFFSHVYRPIPVVQVGDTLGPTGLTVSSVSVYDQIANNTPEQANGDHSLAFWVSTNNDTGQAIVRSSYIQQFGTSGGNSRTVCCGGGTLGALVTDSSGTNLILSNDHILGKPVTATRNLAIVGDPISEPARINYNCEKPHAVGLFSSAPTLSTGIDAALASLNPGEINTTGQIYGIGIPANTIATPVVGMSVAKQGATSGLTCGKIIVTNYANSIPYHPCKNKSFSVNFSNQILVESGDTTHPFDLEGDSGSLIVRQTTAEPVALLFAGGLAKNGQEATFGNPISAVASQLGITFVGGAPHAVQACSGHAEALLSDEATERARLAKEKYEAQLFEDPAVIGVGVGAADDDPTEGVILVMVESGKTFRPIPPKLDGVSTKIMVGHQPQVLQSCVGE